MYKSFNFLCHLSWLELASTIFDLYSPAVKKCLLFMAVHVVHTFIKLEVLLLPFVPLSRDTFPLIISKATF